MALYLDRVTSSHAEAANQDEAEWRDLELFHLTYVLCGEP